MSKEKNSIEYLKKLGSVVQSDVHCLEKAQKEYGNSWKQRGGVGAFMMLARKWDRLEMRLSKDIKGGAKGNASPYDIFAHVLADQRPEGVIDDIRDLRRYLILVEAELASSYGLKIKELPKNAENKNKNSVAAAEDSSSSTLMICGR